MEDNSSSNKRIAKNSILLTIQMVIVLLLTLYITRVVLNILGVEDYGVYNVVCGFVSMFAFLNTSMSNGIQRFFNFELGRHGIDGATKVYNSALIVQVALLIVIIIFAETFGLWYMQHRMVIPPERLSAANWIFQLSILSFAFVIMQAPYLAAILAHERMGYYAAVSVVDVLLKLIIVLTIPYISGDSLIIYGLLLALISVLNFILYFLYCKTNFAEIKISKGIEKELFLSMIGFSGWNVFGSFSNMMKEQGINLVLNLFFGPIVNAARGVAMQVNGGLQSFVSNLSVSIRPQMVQSYAKRDYNRSLNLMFTISKLSCLCLYLVALPILIDINFILKIWLGNNVPEHTDTFVIIIVITSFVNNLNAAVSNLVHATGKMRRYQLYGGFCILLSIPLAYFCLSYGLEPEWALIMAFFSMLITQIVSLFILRSLVPFDLYRYVKDIIVPFFIVVLTTLWIPYIIYEQLNEGFLRFIVILIISFSSVILSIYKFGLSQEEKKFIINIVKIKIKKRNDMKKKEKSIKETIKKVFYPIYLVYHYFTYDIKKKKENKNFLKNGLSVLVAFDRCMTNNGHKYSLAYGTLLGAVREKGFIPHDDDIDTWMWIDDYTPKLIADLEDAGFKLKYSFSVDNDTVGKQETYIYKGVLVDIFFLYKENNGEGCNIVFTNQPDCSNRKESVKKHGGLLPFKITLPVSKDFIRTEFCGHMMPIPANFDEVLKRRYGSDYMIPQPKWNKDKSDKNHVYLFDKLGTYVEYDV